MMSGLKALALIAVMLAATTLCTAQMQRKTTTENPDLAALADGNTRFALGLYSELCKQDGNLFYSPASISIALGMTYGGARGNTATEMANVLHFKLEPQRLHAAFGRLMDSLDVSKQAEPGYRLYIANALWPQQRYPFLPEFIELCRANYRADPRPVDYAKATEAARQTINTWVEQQTEGKIKELLKPGILDALTRLVLTNAIYFKGDWAAKFDERRTEEAPFTLLDGKQVRVPLMNQTGEFGYLDAGDLQVLELPYVGQSLAMVVLLPHARDGLPALEQALDAAKLASWLSGLNTTKVQASLPRFTMTSEFRLKDALVALGMRDAFNPDAADFSGMDGSRWLYISAVVHKAFVEVNEEGTEAAAATGVVMKLRATPQPPPVFRADHPFLLLIRDRRNGSILFLGRVLNPTE